MTEASKPRRAGIGAKIDRIVAAFSPRAAVRRMKDRMQYEALSGAYTGASKTRDALSGWRATAGDADADTLDDLPTLRERSRDLKRNDPVAAATSNVKVTHVVGSGLKLNAAVDRDFLQMSDEEADAWEADVERRFELLVNSPFFDVEGGMLWSDHQELAYRSTLDNGDHFVLLTSNKRPGKENPLALQHIEADRVCNEGNVSDTSTLAGGVEKDNSGAPARFHVMRGHPGQRYMKDMKWDKLPAFGEKTGRPITLHLFRKLRAGQTRGVPDIAPVIEMIKQLGRYTDAEIDAAVKTALFALIVQTETGEGLAGLNIDAWKETRRDYYKNNPINAKGGSSMAVGLFPDDKMEAFDPQRPNAAAEPFLAAMFQQIGMALEIPYEVLISHFSSSWSASQAAMMQMWRFAMGRRAWLAKRFCQPVYEAFLTEEVAAGRVAAPGFFADPLIRAAYCGAEWIGDAKGHINEKQQVDAAKARIDARLSTHKREAAALTGENWDVTRRRLGKEYRQLADMPAADPSAETSSPDQMENDQEDEQNNRTPNRESVHG